MQNLQLQFTTKVVAVVSIKERKFNAKVSKEEKPTEHLGLIEYWEKQ